MHMLITFLMDLKKYYLNIYKRNLKKNTESLSEILEGNSNYDREKIINLTKIAATRLEHLLKGALNGYESQE